MMPPWILPHPGQPTSTGTTVGLPPTSVVSHVFVVYSVFVVALVENPGGIVVIVEDIESVVVAASEAEDIKFVTVAGMVGSVTGTDGDAVGTAVGRPLELIVKVEKVKGGGIITLEGGKRDWDDHNTIISRGA